MVNNIFIYKKKKSLTDINAHTIAISRIALKSLLSHSFIFFFWKTSHQLVFSSQNIHIQEKYSQRCLTVFYACSSNNGGGIWFLYFEYIKKIFFRGNFLSSSFFFSFENLYSKCVCVLCSICTNSFFFSIHNCTPLFKTSMCLFRFSKKKEEGDEFIVTSWKIVLIKQRQMIASEEQNE